MGSEPLDELSRAVADFLFHNVVLQDDPALVNGGPDGPVIEIEAKLGQLVEKDTNQRLKFPVLTETVYDSDTYRAKFCSSMTEVSLLTINGMRHC